MLPLSLSQAWAETEKITQVSLCPLWGKERTERTRWDACSKLSYLILHIQSFTERCINTTGEDKHYFFFSICPFFNTHTCTWMNAQIGFTVICPSVIVRSRSVGSPWCVSCLSIYHACFTLSTSGGGEIDFIFSDQVELFELNLICVGGNYGGEHRK